MLWRKVGVERITGFVPPTNLIIQSIKQLHACTSGVQPYFGHLLRGASTSSPPPPLCHGSSSATQDCGSYYIRSRPEGDIQEKTVCIHWLPRLRHDGSQDRVQLLNTYCIYLSIYIYLQFYLFLLRAVEILHDSAFYYSI